MRKFTAAINENESLKTYKYSVKFDGTVKAYSEGDAGELVDKSMDSVMNSVKGVSNYEIVNIEETEGGAISESHLSVDVNYNEIINELQETINSRILNMSPEDRAIILSRLSSRLGM